MKLPVFAFAAVLVMTSGLARGQMNDSCASPQNVGAGSWAFDTTTSTSDGPSAACGFGGDTADVWFLYTAAQDGNVSITGTAGDGITTFAITILSACGGTERFCIGDVVSEPGILFAVTTGQQFLIRVATYADFEERGQGTLDIQELGFIPGDNCAEPIQAIVGNSLNQWSTISATTETINSGCAVAGEGDVWFEYTAQMTGNAVIDTLGSPGDTVLSVFPSCGANPIACSDNVFVNGTVEASRVCIPVVANQVYLIRIATKFNRASGRFSIAEFIPPTNETCATAIPVSEGAFAWNSVGACSSGPVSACTRIATERTLWYRYTPSATGTVAIGTCGASGDSVVSVFNGPCTGGEVDCSDNICGDDGRVVLHTVAGTPLLIRIHSNYFSSITSGILSIAQVAAPVNDNCSGAIAVSAGTTTFDLENATSNFGLAEQSACTSNLHSFSDVWFRFTPASSGSIEIDTCSASDSIPNIYDTVLSVWPGCAAIAPIACNNNSDTCSIGGSGLKSRIIMDVTAGAGYYIRVGKYDRDTPGTVGQINLAFTPSGCAADFNHSGSLSVQDIFDFLNAWFNASPGADFNHVGGITVQDIFDFLGAWFAGC